MQRGRKTEENAATSGNFSEEGPARKARHLVTSFSDLKAPGSDAERTAVCSICCRVVFICGGSLGLASKGCFAGDCTDIC